jgi:hypothetical protein
MGVANSVEQRASLVVDNGLFDQYLTTVVPASLVVDNGLVRPPRSTHYLGVAKSIEDAIV